MKDLFRNLDLAGVANRVRTFTTNLQDYQMITPTLARVVVTLTGTMPQREELRASVAELFKGHGAPVANSFRELTQLGGIRTVVGYVKASHEVRTMDDFKEKRTKAMASNLLMDETDKSLWEIRKGASGQYLVKQGNEDLSELAYSIKSKRTGMPMLASLAEMPTEAKEFAAFVDTKIEEVMYGYVVGHEGNKTQVIAYGETEPTLVDSDQLVEVSNLDGEDIKALGIEMAAAVSGDKQAMIEYYRKAYQHSPEYVQKIIEMIDQHAFA